MTKEEAISKVVKALRLAEKAGTAEEAATAVAIAAEIALRHGIEISEVDTSSSQPEELIQDLGRNGEWLDVFETALPTWKAFMASAISRANSCKVYSSRTWTPDRPVKVQYKDRVVVRTDRATLGIIGRAGDAQTVRYLYLYLVREIERLCREQGLGRGRTWSNNFKHGAVLEIRRRLHEMKSRVETEYQQAGKSSALVRYNERSLSVERWAKANTRLKTTHMSNGAFDDSGRAAGAAAASTLSLAGGGSPGLAAPRAALPSGGS